MLRPETTEIQLVCRSLSSSAAVPGGEVFRYEFSPRGTFLLAISSSRMIVIDTTTPSKELPVTIKRELKILRRPVSAAILDDGSVLAVLSSEHKVNVYNLQQKKIKRVKSVDLDNAPRAIALAPGGSVLAVAYDGGVEVASLDPDFDHKRAVKCDLVDSLCFSLDGSVLLGSTLGSGSPATVVISAPFFSDAMAEENTLCQMWTTQILFPRTSRDNSHATLLTHHGDNSSWTFTYDKAFASFRAVRVDDLRNGHTYFSAPTVSANPIPPTVLPAASSDGGVVASGFGSKAVWIYGIPSDLESGGDGNGEGSGHGTPAGNGLHIGATFVPQWQHAVDRSRNIFVQGKKICDVKGLVGLKFSVTDKGERLIAVAAGIESDDNEESIDSEGLEGGRLVLFNFARSPSKGDRNVISVDVGDGSNVELQQLEEQQNDMEAEVNIVRRRTMTQRQQRERPLSIVGAPPVPQLPAGVTPVPISVTPVASRTNSELSNAAAELDDDEEGPTLSEALEWSYSHTDPRSQTTLQRAATAARANAERTVRRRAGAEPGPNFAVTNYRLLGLREEEWVEPPPPYVEKLTAVPLYDYESRLLERARSMGIMNPNERVRRRSSGSELDMDRRDRDPLASGASSPRLRRNAPSLRITSPVSPGGGGLSRNGSVSAGPRTTFPGFGQLGPGRLQSETVSTSPSASSFSHSNNQSSEVRTMTAASSRRSSIQLDPPGGILPTAANDNESNPPSNRQSLQSNPDSLYTSSPARTQPQRAVTPTMHQNDSPTQSYGRLRQRDPETIPQRVFLDEGSDLVPPVPVIPNAFRSNSLPIEAPTTPGRNQRPPTDRPQSAILSPGSVTSFAHANASMLSLPNFEMRTPSRSPVLPQTQRPTPQPPSPPAGHTQFTQPPPHPQFARAPQSQMRPETPTRNVPAQLQQPLISRLPSHRARRGDEPMHSPALSIPSNASVSQPVTPVAPLNIPVTSATAPVTPVSSRDTPTRPMMPVSAMVAQPGPPPGSSGSNRSINPAFGHPQFRTAMSGNGRNTLSLTVTPPMPALQFNPQGSDAGGATISHAVTHPPATRNTSKRSKSRAKRHQHNHSNSYVNPAFLPIPDGHPIPSGPQGGAGSSGTGHVYAQMIDRPLPSPGRRASKRRSPLHGGFHAASASTSSVNLARNATRAERSAARAASTKKKRGWGRKNRENGDDEDVGSSRVGGSGMEESFEVVRRTNGNANGAGPGNGAGGEAGLGLHPEDKGCSIM
ncbi:hypothetical protein ABW19_dt0206302 [Dactylella cylindrospora]|nr:hypothetical protein ABW19_dt0206302 [Dactylella cylindrospora]